MYLHEPVTGKAPCVCPCTSPTQMLLAGHTSRQTRLVLPPLPPYTTSAPGEGHLLEKTPPAHRHQCSEVWQAQSTACPSRQPLTSISHSPSPQSHTAPHLNLTQPLTSISHSPSPPPHTTPHLNITHPRPAISHSPSPQSHTGSH